MKRKLIVSLIIFIFLLPFSLRAVTSTQDLNTSIISTSTTSSVARYLGWRKVGLLPGNPFYFWKIWRERLRIALTPDAVKRAELELSLLNKRLAELNEVSKKGLKPEILRKAFRNYEVAMDRLKERLESLKETSANPRIDELLEKLADLQIRHQEVLEKILQSNATSTRPFLEKARKHFYRAIIPLSLRFESQEKYLERLNKKVKEIQPLRRVPYGELRQLELFQRLENAIQEILQHKNISSSTQDKLLNLQKHLRQRKEQRIKVLERQGYSSSTLEFLLKQDNQQEVPERIPKIKRLPHTPPRLHRLPSGNPPNGHGSSLIKPN